VCAWGQGAGGELVTVRSVRFWTLGPTTRVAIELSAETTYKYEKLHDPERLFVDLVESKSAVGPKSLQVIRVGDKLVKQVRVAQKDPRTTRVVLDLEGPVEHEISQLANPSRIIVEVRARDKAGEATAARSRTGGEKIEARRAEPAANSVELKVEAARVEAPKPEAPTPEPAKPEAAKSAPPRPEASKPVETVPSESANASPAVRPAPAAARVPGTGARSLTRALGLKIGRVVLDAGHGGHDHGTTGPTGLTEKELVLDVVLRLGALIEQRLGGEVVYTRDTDRFIPLEERTALANQNRADLFLSIHANSSPLKAISGAEVYYLNFSTSKEVLDVAARENAGHGKSIFELRELIQKIALKDKVEESREFAARLQSALSSTWTKMNPAARNRGVKKAPFVVLIGASMPSVLAEIGFLSNRRDEDLLRKPDQRQRIAEALYKGIEQYAAGLGQTRAALRSGPDQSAQATR
jgi:N-acetylmuramoyl-L-alanine amidase